MATCTTAGHKVPTLVRQQLVLPLPSAGERSGEGKSLVS